MKKVIASMTVGKDVRCVVVLCQGSVGQTTPGGWLVASCSPLLPPRGFCAWLLSQVRTVRAPGRSCTPRYGRDTCVRAAVRRAGAHLALGVIWLKEDWSGCQISLLGLLLLVSSVTKTQQKPALSLYGRGSVSLCQCR